MAPTDRHSDLWWPSKAHQPVTVTEPVDLWRTSAHMQEKVLSNEIIRFKFFYFVDILV